MGNILSYPNLSETSKSINEKNIRINFNLVQGYRKSMEDYYSFYKDNKYLYIALFDGHGGYLVADYLSKYFLKELSKTLNTVDIDNIIVHDVSLLLNIISNIFIAMDNKISKDILFNISQGSTVTCAIFSRNNVVIAYCGDSPVIIHNGKQIVYRSIDHKPSNYIEFQRIEKSGHKVINKRIDGIIDISRCMGDFRFKSKNISAIIAEPFIYVIGRNKVKFIILLTDGISNSISMLELTNYIDYRLQLHHNLNDICKSIIGSCIYREGTDNLSIVICVLHEYVFNNKLNISYEKDLKVLKNKVKQLYNNNYNNTLPLITSINILKKIKKNIFKFCPSFELFYVVNLIENFSRINAATA